MSLAGAAVAVAVATAPPSVSTRASATYWLDPAVSTKVAEAARGLFLEVAIAFKPFDPASDVRLEDFYTFERYSFSIKNLVKYQQRARMVGERVGTDGTFVAPALVYDLTGIESVEAKDSEGNAYLARVTGFSRRGGLVWFKADGLAGKPLPPRKRVPFKAGTDFIRAGATLKDGFSQLSVGPFSLTEKTWLSKAEKRRELETFAVDGLLFDPKGDWAGVCPEHPYLTVEGEWPIDPDDMRKAWVSRVDFEDLESRLGDWLERRLPLVSLRFRQTARTGSLLETFALLDEDKNANVKGRIDFAFPVKGRLALVPEALDRDLVRRLESVTLSVDGRTLKGRFVGSLSEIGGYLVEAESDLPPLAAGPAPPLPADGELFVAHELRVRGGRLESRPHQDYFEGWLRGYKDSLWRQAQYTRKPGAVLSDLSGLPFAVTLEQARYEGVPEKSRWEAPEPLIHVYPLSALVEFLRDPSARVDPLVRPMSVQEIKARRPWLGVETQNMTKELAEALGAASETQDGSVGQLVNVVYPGSPAARLGLKPDDILLRFREESKKDDVLVPSDLKDDALAASRPPSVEWFTAPKPFSQFLTRFDVGERVHLTYARNHKERAAELTFEEGPPDLAASAKLHDTRSGLTLAEIPYDVRYALRLGDAQGLLVFDVDRGSPAAVAAIRPLEIVLDVAGSPVPTLARFQELLGRAPARGSELRLRTRFLDRTRYTDLKLSAGKP